MHRSKPAAIVFLCFNFVLAECCSAAINGVHVIGVTATQAIVAYTAPNTSACSLAISETVDAQGNPQMPLIHDLDPALFPGANQDNRTGNIVSGSQRSFVIGRRVASMAADSRYYSRALATNTNYYGRITCGADTQLFNFKTANIPLGIGYSDPWPADPATPGGWATPSSPGNVVNEQFIEPQTGVRLQRATYPGIGYTGTANVAFATAYNQGKEPCDTDGPWMNPCRPVSGSSVASVANSTGWLVLRPGNQSYGWGATASGFGFSLNQFQVNLTGRADGHDLSSRMVDVCLSMNAGASCASQIQTATFANKNGTVSVGSYQPGATGLDPWLFDSSPRINRQEATTHQGMVAVDGATVVQKNGDSFSDYWTTGGQGRIRLSNVSSADACASPPANTHAVEATIAEGFGSVTHSDQLSRLVQFLLRAQFCSDGPPPQSRRLQFDLPAFGQLLLFLRTLG